MIRNWDFDFVVKSCTYFIYKKKKERGYDFPLSVYVCVGVCTCAYVRVCVRVCVLIYPQKICHVYINLTTAVYKLIFL